MKKTKGNKYVKILLLFIVLLMLILFYVMNQELVHAALNGDIEFIRESLIGHSFSAYGITFILMIIQNTFTIIPLILIITLNYTLFGFVNGFIWGWLCSIFAAVIIFICVKYLFQDMLMKKFKQELTENIEQNGFLYVFQGRIFPFIPSSFINILAGLSSIRFRDFLLGTVFGNFIYFFLLTLIPAGLFSMEETAYGIGIVILIVVLFLYWLYKKNKRKSIRFFAKK